jgi:hypothetical protein
MPRTKQSAQPEDRLSIRASAKQKLILRRAADLRHTTMSQFVPRATKRRRRSDPECPTTFQPCFYLGSPSIRTITAKGSAVPHSRMPYAALGPSCPKPPPPCVFFVVDAMDSEAKTYYKGLGMVPSPTHPMRLFLHYKDL